MPLSPEQVGNAAAIYSIGRQMGMSSRDIQIALITAMQESGLRNLNYGDRDSLGLFQQRPSQGWGTREQVTNVRYATTKFFTELKKVSNRGSMSMTQAAQAVQRSAYPDAYAKHVPLVREYWPQIVTAGGGKATNMDNGRPYQVDTYVKGPGGTWTVGGQETLGGLEKGPRGGGGTPFPIPELPDPNVLGAQWSEVLSAPQFMQAADPYAQAAGVEIPSYQSPLSDTTFRQVRDQAASDGNWQPTKGMDGWRAAVVQMARKQVGTPYVWGGSAPGGFDCSGLIQYAFSKAGIQMPRVSYQQANSGQRVALNTLRPGDLVAWDNSSRNNGADHIALYIGNGQIIEAPRPGIGVRIRKLGHNEGAWGVRVSR